MKFPDDNAFYKLLIPFWAVNGTDSEAFKK